MQAENIAVKGSQSLQDDAAAGQNDAQQAAAAMQAVDGLQQSLSQIAGKLLPVQLNSPCAASRSLEGCFWGAV